VVANNVNDCIGVYMTKPMLRLVPEYVEKQNSGPLSFEKYAVPFYCDLKIFARKLCSRNPSRADDLVQAVMLKAFAAWDRFIPDERLETRHAVKVWLYKICSNTYMTGFTRDAMGVQIGNHRTQDLVAAMHGYADVDPRRQVDSPLGDEVRAAIAALAPDHRDVVEGFYLCEMTCAELAEALGILKSTVFTRLGRARALLGKVLVDYARAEYGVRDVEDLDDGMNGAVFLDAMPEDVSQDEVPESDEPDYDDDAPCATFNV